jgi:hypothetical protein
MTKPMSFITATYFISLIKSWLQGTKTRQEILTETADVLQIPDIAHADVTYVLSEVARDMNEDFYLDIVNFINYGADTVPTRAGLIHHLKALLANNISLAELVEWATWYRNGDDGDMSAGIFEDFAVEYFCLDFLPAYDDTFSPHMCRRALEILQLPGQHPLREKIALTLLPEHELGDFVQFVYQYKKDPLSLTELDHYLLGKFGMDHESFPYMQELNMGQPLLLLQKAQLISG